MRLPSMKVVASFFLAAILSVPVWATNTSANSAIPGTLNYVEGQVLINGQPLDSKSIGSADLPSGQTLVTTNGKAEVLLTPGVFLRVGKDSSLKMISPSITDTEVGLEKGHAMIEVAEIHRENDIRISGDGATAQLLKTGLYDFNLNQGQLRVFDGKASVQEDGKEVSVKSGRELSLASNITPKAQKFDKKAYEEGDLYRWSSLRSAYLAEANVDAAGIYANSGWGPWGTGWLGANWYWDPWFDAFTFIPGNGIFYSPFGWGFYSPWWVSQAPFFLYGRYGYGYRPYYHHFSTDYRNWGGASHYVGAPTYAHGVYRGPGSVGGFRSGPGMLAGSRGFGGPRGGGLSGGGFHGGAGFHGGGGVRGR